MRFLPFENDAKYCTDIVSTHSFFWRVGNGHNDFNANN